MNRQRDCVILVADSNMAATFQGYFSRDRWHLSLGCGEFEIDTNIDLMVDEGGNDPGVYARAHELLRPCQNSHRHALVVLDCEWSGSPGKAGIVAHVTAGLVRSGWAQDAVKVIAIEPELENWLWQDNPHVAQALCYQDNRPLRQRLADEGLWPVDAAKPPRPKETAQWVLKQAREPRSSAIYRQLAERISIRGCTDAAFAEMLSTLRNWFPAEGAQ